MRRLITVVVVLLVLAVAADRVAVALATRAVASALRTSAALDEDPSVHIRGFPFLTQVLGGRYDRLDVETGAFTRGGVRLSGLDVSVSGVSLTLSQALSGKVTGVPVEGLTGTAVVSYADVARVGKLAGVSVQPAGDLVKVTAKLTVLGQSVTATSSSSVRLSGRSIVITAQKVSVLGASSAALNSALAGRLDLRVPIGVLPYGLALTGVDVTEAGLVLAARTGPTVLPVRAPA